MFGLRNKKDVINVADDYSPGEKWNMAMAYHQRIDDLLTMCTQAQIKGDGLMWYKAIYRLYIEIQAKMKPEEKRNGIILINDLTEWKSNALKIKKGKIPTSKFVEAELFLRQVLEDKNMLTPKPEDLREL